MALTKVTALDRYEIVGKWKTLQIREATWVEDDGSMVGDKSYHRRTLEIDDDVSSESAEIQAVCTAIWPQSLKDEWAAYRAEYDAQ